jgi:hypothetical protein
MTKEERCPWCGKVWEGRLLVLCEGCRKPYAEARAKERRAEFEADVERTAAYARAYKPDLRLGAEPMGKDRPSDFGYGLPPRQGRGWLDELGEARGVRELNFDDPFSIPYPFEGGQESRYESPTPKRTWQAREALPSWPSRRKRKR